MHFGDTAGRVAGMSAQESAAAQPSTQQVVLMPSSSSHQLTQQHAGYMPPSCQYMPAQQPQHTAVQVQMQPQHDVTMRQASRQPQALPGFPSAASLRAQPEAAQRPIGLGTTPLGSHHDSAQPSRQPAAAAAAAPSSAPTATAGPPAALATAAGMIASQLPQNSTVSTPPGNATSQILGQQANHWRQATRKKGTGLLDLVPSVAKQLATKQPATASQLRSAVPGDAPVQPDTAQQDCQAFRPAVQECIAAAGLPLSKPFYQQAAEGATDLCTAHTNAGRSTRVAVQHRNANSQACGAAMPDANAETDACASAHEQQGAVERQQAAQPAFGQPASPAISDDLDLGMDILLEEEQSKARRYMSATHWPSAGIAGMHHDFYSSIIRRGAAMLHFAIRYVNGSQSLDIAMSLAQIILAVHKACDHCQIVHETDTASSIACGDKSSRCSVACPPDNLLNDHV